MGRITGATYGDGVFVGSVDNGDLLINNGSPTTDIHYGSFWGTYLVGSEAFILRAIAGNILTQGYYTGPDITRIYAAYHTYAQQFPTPAESQTGWTYSGPPIAAPGPVPAPLPVCARTFCPDSFYDQFTNPPPPPPPPGGPPPPPPPPGTVDNTPYLLIGAAIAAAAVAYLATGGFRRNPF